MNLYRPEFRPVSSRVNHQETQTLSGQGDVHRLKPVAPGLVTDQQFLPEIAVLGGGNKTLFVPVGIERVEREARLAGPGLADNSQCFAGLHREAHIVDGALLVVVEQVDAAAVDRGPGVALADLDLPARPGSQ